jgi:hypothetical protein
VQVLAAFTAVAATGWSQETTNPHFDSDLSGWTTFLAPGHTWSEVDFADNPASGSLLVVKDFAGSPLSRATQCVTVVPGATMVFRVRALVLESGDPADLYIDLTPHSDAACQTSTGLNRVSETPPQGEWTTIVHGPHVVPAGIQSIEVGLGVFEAFGSTVPVRVHLDAADFSLFESGFENATCSEWSTTVPFCITPNVGLRVELTWDTTGDPDQGDAVGTDLDVHLRHPDGGEAWGGAFDCSPANPMPDWGTAGSANDPVVIFEDDDGAGPEAIEITDPESVEYDIGVHYVDDLGFGLSYATLAVFVDGVPVYQYDDKQLTNGEFWHLGAVQWPGGSVTVVDTVTAGIP